MNFIVKSDNLKAVKKIRSNSVDLIATDPPFNTNKDWGEFTDKWQGGLKEYLSFMEIRCFEFHRIIKSTGSLYLHCDPTASHYLKVMLDGIFGIENFKSEIIWKRSRGSGNNCISKFYCEHDVILFYTKSKEYVFNPIYKPVDNNSSYNKVDENNRRYMVKKPDGKRRKKESKFYLDEQKGVPVQTIWYDIKNFKHNKKGYTRYPTQKPIELYQRIIKASTNHGDLVLDPFLGSGTTIDAAQSLGRKWAGIDLNENSIEISEKRMSEKYGLFLKKEIDYKVIVIE